MRVMFDCYWWFEGPPSNRHVLRDIVTTWSTEYPQDELAGVFYENNRNELAKGGDFPGVYYWTRLRPHGLGVALGSGAALRDFQPCVYIGQNFTPILKNPAVKLTYIHDLMFLEHPEWFSFVERAYFRGMSLTARFADSIVTSSESEAKRIARHVSRPVDAVGLGLSSELTEITPTKSVAMRLGLVADSFILAVGRLNKRKNLGRAIDAARASGLVCKDFPLVVVGERDGRQSQLSESAREGIDRNEILFTGYIGDSELTWLYKNTRALVFVSFDEGFGMPPVEAAFFGTKSVVSDIPVFRETLQDNAVFVNPNNVQDISRGIRQVCDQPAMPIEPSWWQSKHSWEVSVSRIRHLAMTLAQERR